MKVSGMTSRAVVLAGVALIMTLVGGRIVKGFNPQPDPPGVWGMFGITPSETARLNVVNIVLPGIPPGPCSVQLNFISATGTVLKGQAFALKPSQSAFLDITGVAAGGGFRTE